MLGKLLSVVMAGLLIQVGYLQPVAASTKGDKDVQRIEKVKAATFKLGTGPAALAEVKLRDKTKLRGFIREARESDFVLVDFNTGAATTVDYSQVSQVKRLKGSNDLSFGAETRSIITAAGAAAGLLFLLALIAPR